MLHHVVTKNVTTRLMLQHNVTFRMLQYSVISVTDEFCLVLNTIE